MVNEEKNEKAEFCWNSKRWIEIMTTSRPLESCPHQLDNFFSCQDCEYYELREPTPYLKRFRKIMRGD